MLSLIPEQPVRRHVAQAALLLLAWLPGPALQAEPNQQLVQPPPSLVQRLRRLLNLAPPLAVGGSRSGGAQAVCLLSPWPTSPARNDKPALALVPTATPTLLSAAPLNELQLLRNNRIVWQQRASSTQAIGGAIPWPLTPLQPDEQLRLRLRPRGAAGGDFAEIHLQLAAAPTRQRFQLLRSELQRQPSRWPAVLEAQLAGNPAMALALATDPAAPAAIQQAIQAAGGCGLESPR